MSFPALPYLSLPGMTAGSGTCDYPAETDVRDGVTYDFGGMVGSYSGAADYPSEDDVRYGISFDFGAQTGNLTLPAEVDVLEGVQYGTSGTEFTGTLELNPQPEPSPADLAGASYPFAAIAANIIGRVAASLNIGLDFVFPVANDEYKITVSENLFAYIRFYGPSPVDPRTGAPFSDYGAGRRARVVGRRFRVYIYTRSGEDTFGDDTIALGGNNINQLVTDPPETPGQYVAEELVLNALDDYIPKGDDDICLTIGPVHWLDGDGGPAQRKPENDAGLLRSSLDFQAVYVLAIQATEPAPAGVPSPVQVPNSD